MSKVTSYFMTPDELKAYIEKLPAAPKKVKSSELLTTAPQHKEGKIGNGKIKYLKKGGEYR